MTERADHHGPVILWRKVDGAWQPTSFDTVPEALDHDSQAENWVVCFHALACPS